MWEKFCTLFALEELWADESIRRNNDRVRARDRILPQIRALIATFTRDEVIAKLEGTGLPFAPIGRPEDMATDPHLLASGALETVYLPDGTTALLPILPVAMDFARSTEATSLPQPGADGAAILQRLGYSADAARFLSK